MSDFIRALLIFPRCLGGYPVINIFDLLFKGFPDPVSVALSHLKLITIYGSPSLQRTACQILDVPLNSSKNFAYLFEDPVSLNLLHPSSPSDTIKKYFFSFLQSANWVINPYFKEFFPSCSQVSKPPHYSFMLHEAFKSIYWTYDLRIHYSRESIPSLRPTE